MCTVTRVLGMRRQLLALDAARYGDRELSARINGVPVPGDAAASWGVEWATGSRLDPGVRHAPTCVTDHVTVAGTAVVDGCPVAVLVRGGAGVGPDDE